MRVRSVLCTVLIAACNSGTQQASVETAKPSGPSEQELRAERERNERAEHAANVAHHRELEGAQQDALAGTCKNPEAWAKLHCAPTCYPPEPKDPRAGTKVSGPVEVQHRVCQREDAQFVIADELDPKLKVSAFHKHFPRAPKAGTWQADLASWYSEHQVHKLPRRDAIAIVGNWKDSMQPITHEALKCVTLVHYTTATRGKVDDCGARGKTACEASNNAAARAINLVHFRLAEAKQMHAAGNEDGCSAAALEAVATARGAPRWRQYAKLNVDQWTEGLTYRTRFDGTLDEDTLFAQISELGAEAEHLYVECAAMPAKTTPEQEHAFHTCP